MDKPSRLFVGYRALGFTSNGIPLGIRYHQKRRANYVVTCVGRALHTYSCSKLGIINVSNKLPEPISCLAIDRIFDYVGCGKDIFAYAKGKQIRFTYRGHTNDVHLLLPFADHLVSVDKSSCVKIWVIRQEVEYSQLEFDSSVFEISALVHPQGLKNLILFGSRQGRLQLWNVNTSKLLYTFAGWDSPVTVLEQSPEEKVIAIGLADGRIIIHNIEYDKTVMTFRQEWGEVTAISFRTDGQHVMCTGSPLGHIALWDLEKRKLQSQIRCTHNAPVTGMKCLPGEPLMVTSSADNSLKIWIFDQPDHGGRLLRQRSGHSEPPTKVRFHGYDGQVVLSAAEDSTLQSFSTVHDMYNKSLGRASYNKAKTKKSGLQLDEHRMPPITDFASETSRQSDWDGILACHRGETMATLWNFQRSTMGAHRLKHPRFDEGNKQLRHAAALCVDVSPCGNFGIVGYSSGHVDVFNMQSGLHRGSYGDDRAHAGAVLGVNIDGLNQLTVSVGADACVRFWKFKTRELIHTLKMDAAVARSLMHRESSMLAVALDDFRVAIIDVDTQRLVRMFAGHSNTVTDLTFSADGRWLITSGMDSTIKTWDLPSGKLVDCFLVEQPVTSLAMSPTGMFLATTHVGDLGVYLWSNMTLFGSAILTPLPADFEPSELELPSTSHLTQGERDPTVEEDSMQPVVEYEPIEQISPDLVTFSQLPQSRWKNLLNLDIIRQRNKPKQPPTKPKSAPFFMPTVAGLEPKFQIPEDDSSQTDKNSKILPGAKKLLSEFGRLIEKSRTEKNYDKIIETLKSMGPSAIELELTLLMPDVEGDSFDLVLDFIDFLVHLFETKRDTELATSYLGLFLKLHGEILYTNESLSRQLERLETSQLEACNELSRQTNKILCLTEYLRGAML